MQHLKSIEERLLPVPRAPHPKLRTDETSIPLHAITLWPIGAILSILVFPGKLDRRRFEDAVIKTCQIWPNTIGRYSKKPRLGRDGEYDFSIESQNSPLPVVYQELETDSILPNAEVIQPNLAPYIPDMPPTLGIPDTDSAQVVIKVTTILPSNRTVLGLMWGHVLGDAASSHKFLGHLSYFYANGVSASLPEADYPSFYPHISIDRYPPSQEVIEKYATTQIRPVPIMGEGGMAESYIKTFEEDEQLTITLSQKELKVLKEKVSAASMSGGRLSDQDVLTGWWVTILRQSGEDVRKMVYTVNYRNIQKSHPSFPANLPTLSANVAQMRLLDLPSIHHSDDLYQAAAKVASTARQFLDGLKSDPEGMLDWLSVPAYFMEQAAIETKAQIMVPVDGQCLVNSNLRYDWVFDFGFPHNQVAYHTTFSTHRFLRVFQANPAEGHERGIELTWSVKKGGDARKRTMSAVEASRQGWMQR